MPGVGYFSHCASRAADNDSAMVSPAVAVSRLITIHSTSIRAGWTNRDEGLQVSHGRQTRTMKCGDLLHVQLQPRDVLVEVHRERIRSGWPRRVRGERREGVALDQDLLLRQID